ncbi:MAG: chemotaxis protein CheA, partial [Candidatus Adiutrix sp.]|nr:chemotaxis protein CheA [Candidatus Adiutrix sp.]
MAFDLEHVEELLNSISLDLMMISADNLVEISGILVKVEPLEASFAPLDSDLPGRIIKGIEESLKDIIRGQTQETDRALALVGDGLTMLQELARSLPVGAPFKGDVAGWSAALAGLMVLEGLTPPPYEALDSPGEEAPDPLPAPDQPLSLERFKAEFIPALEEIQMALVTVENKSDPQAALGELARHFRAILGPASLLDLWDLGVLAFNAGGLIEYVAADNAYSTAITDILLRTCDYMLKGLRGLALTPEGGWELDPEAYTRAELSVFVDELWMARQGVLPPSSREPETTSGSQQPAKPKKIGEILVEKGLISEGELGGLIEAQQKSREVPLGDILVAAKYITEEDLAEALAEQKKSPGKKLGEILVALGKVDYEHIDEAMKNQEGKREAKLGEFLLKSKIGAPEKVALALREQKQSEGGYPGALATQTVKVETLKLDGLIDLVGELVIAQSLIVSNPEIISLKTQKVIKDLAQVSRITSELQRNAMSMRMVQIQQTFQKMNRLVRDLAHKFEKDVKFETLGGDTDIDRNMVESIYDPLVHLVRNALDHGVEPPDERRAHHKPPQGIVRLKAYHQGGNVVIELSDDGRGLDRAKVRQKALTQGLVSPGENLSDAALHALVFHPGFSTADQISDISGRGVGMDVVKKSIERLRGKVDFTSVEGHGSVMTIRLPLTLAIIDGMIVRVGEHRYILPTISIIESFRPLPEDYFTVKNQGEMIKVREKLVPLIRLDRIVGAAGAVSSPEEALVVVVENEGELRCLLVDEVLGKQEV